MTILMTDAKNSLSPEALEAFGPGNLADVLYADDTLIVGVKGQHVEEYMKTIEQHGKEYGLQPH